MRDHEWSFPGLRGRIALVTGGSRGLGADLGARLAEAGVSVGIVGRDQAAVDRAVALASAHGTAAGFLADLTEEDQVRELEQEVGRALGRPTLLAAFAGGSGAPEPTLDMPLSQWRAVIDDNLTSTLLTIRAFAPGMIDGGQGAIVTMASAAARLPGGASAAYSVAKAGTITLTRHLAKELGPSGVRVNCVSPSAIVTDRLAAQPDEVRRELADRLFPLKRLGQPSDVSDATMFLLSDASSWISGVSLDVAGGQILW